MDDLLGYAQQHDGVFSLAVARSYGLREDAIERAVGRRWTRLYQGVFIVRGAPVTASAMLRAACLAGAPHAAASHRSAASLYDLPGGKASIAELTCPRWLRTKHPSLIVHESTRLDPADVQLVLGIPTTRPERLFIELASIYKSPDFMETVLHAMLRKRLTTVAATTSTFRRLAGRGRPGIAVARQVLERWDPTLNPTESNPETQLLQILRRAGLGRVVTQFVIRDATGAFVARADIGLPDRKATVEYESDENHSDDISAARDDARQLRVNGAGWLAFPARKADLRNGGVNLIAAIRALTSEVA